MLKTVLLLIVSLLLTFTATSYAGKSGEVSNKQTLITPKQPSSEENPLVVIYTLSTCPHCKEAKEYLNNNKIPFINLEVDTDEKHMEALVKIFDSMGVPEEKRGVPLLVIGNRIRIQGFNEEKLTNALKDMASTPR